MSLLRKSRLSFGSSNASSPAESSFMPRDFNMSPKDDKGAIKIGFFSPKDKYGSNFSLNMESCGGDDQLQSNSSL